MNSANHSSDKPTKSTPKKMTHFLKNPYYVIAGLLVIILMVVFYIILSNRGKQTVEVTTFSPIDEVQQTTNFTIEFSKNLVSDSLLNVQLDQAFVDFKPAIPGKFRWIERNKIRFYPEVLLAPSTKYSAAISPSIASDYGFVLTK